MTGSFEASQENGMRYIGVEELSAILGRSVATIRTQATREPEKLPPQPKNKTTSQLRWLLATVWKWMATMEAAPPGSDSTASLSIPKKRRGAPTAKERKEAQNAGMSITEFRAVNSK